MAACLYRSFVVDRGVKCQLALRGFERPSTLQPDWNRRGESGLVPCGHPSSHDAEPEDSTCPAYMGPVAGNRIEPVSYVAGLGSRHLFRWWCGRRDFNSRTAVQGGFPGRQRSAKPRIGRLISYTKLDHGRAKRTPT